METKSFILEKTENLDKLSCHFYDPSLLKIISKLKEKGIQLSNLSEKITYGSGKWELRTTDYVSKDFPKAVKLLQISNISKQGSIIDTKRDKYIPKELHEKWKVSQIKKGDLIIAITGTLGRIAFFDEDYEANLNQALGVIRLKKEYNGIKVLPKFIHLYLNSYYANIQLNYYGGFRSGQSGLSLDEIGYVYVFLPSEDKQKEILGKVNKIRKEAIEHYKKYLFYSDKSKNHPLEILKIKMPSEKEKIFIFEMEFKDRIDAINNSPFLDKLQKNIKSYGGKNLNYFLKKAKNKFTYSNFYNLIDLDNIDENIGMIKNWKEVSQLNSSKTTFKENNILISKLGGEKGNVILVEEKFNNFLGSGELVDFELNEKFNKKYLLYLFYLLRSPYISKQIEYTLSGCSRMRINGGEMENLLIPFTENNEIIDKIINECSELRKKAISEKEQYIKKMREIFIKFSEYIKI